MHKRLFICAGASWGFGWGLVCEVEMGVGCCWGLGLSWRGVWDWKESFKMVMGGKDGMPHCFAFLFSLHLQRSSFDMTVRGQRCSINATDEEIVLCVDRFQIPDTTSNSCVPFPHNCFPSGQTPFKSLLLCGQRVPSEANLWCLISAIGEQGITKKP